MVLVWYCFGSGIGIALLLIWGWYCVDMVLAWRLHSILIILVLIWYMCWIGKVFLAGYRFLTAAVLHSFILTWYWYGIRMAIYGICIVLVLVFYW